ncbi:MAG: alpha-L-glutamate ligase-like protein [Alphaproteobacteria bacterium]|nr:alpha-L-glutamate ligase-like protein [Alphaproteobacteria bacterium]
MSTLMARVKNMRKKGVMGINERNLRLIAELNPRRLMRLVNDKTITKKLAIEAGIPVPELLGLISNSFDMRRLKEMLDHPHGVAIKPANGSQGNGIMVVTGPMKGGYALSNGRRILYEDLRFHVMNILSGMYSLGGLPDTALIEERVRFAGVFDEISFKGVPDVRIIVLKGVPILAMLRLPTADSDGKANLHKGGVGVGLDLVTGLTQQGMQYNRLIDLHPDTANELLGLQTPFWDDMLMMAARAYDVTGLGYLGADIVIDAEKGPLLLELNARPGIAIQVANRFGLRGHVEPVLAADTSAMTPQERIAFGKEIYRSIHPARKAA